MFILRRNLAYTFCAAFRWPYTSCRKRIGMAFRHAHSVSRALIERLSLNENGLRTCCDGRKSNRFTHLVRTAGRVWNSKRHDLLRVRSFLRKALRRLRDSMPSVASAMLRCVSLRPPMRTGTPVKTWYIVQLWSLSIRLPYWVSSVSETGAPPSFSHVSILSAWRRCLAHVSMVYPFM